MLSDELPPLPAKTLLRRVMPDDFRYGDVIGYTADQMREYGRACERAAYKLAAEACRAQKNPPPVLIADQVHYDPANVMAERCATVVSLLGADK